MANGTFVNPTQKHFCPHCFEQFYLADCQIRRIIVDEYGMETELIEPAPQGFANIAARMRVPALVGRTNLQQRARRVCPNCGQSLPRNYESMNSNIIAVLGGPGAGKTHYIASLIHELSSKSIRQMLGGEALLTALNDEVSKRYNTEMREPLFDRNEVLEATHRATPGGGVREPLIYNLSLGNGQRVSLFFYDMAGDDIVDKDMRVRQCEYIFHARALIFLIDPLNSPGIRRQLRGEDSAGGSTAGVLAASMPAADMVNNIMNDYWDHQAQPHNQKLTIPTAVCYSKSDYLRYVVPDPDNSHLSRVPDYTHGLRWGDLDGNHSEVRQLIQIYDEQLLAVCESVFANYHYFAVSATDCAANDRNHFDSVRPFRCADPLIWLLHASNLITLER